MTEKPPGRVKKYVDAIKGAQFAAGFVLGICLMFFGGKSFLGWASAAPPLSFQELEVANMQDETFAFSEVATGYRLVYFWASWNKRSAQDLPNLAKACKELKSAGCNCIGISDESPKVIQSFHSAYQENIQILRSPKAFFEVGLKGLPTFYLLDSNGNILLSKTGLNHWEKPSQIQKIKILLP